MATSTLDRTGELTARYVRVRETTEMLCRPLAPEDCVVQSMPDVSPTRWHLAHVTWFFETFVLSKADPGYASPDPAFATLFNSYYNRVGEQFPRARRGLLTRPTVAEILDYRHRVDDAMRRLLEGRAASDAEIAERVVLGLHHEQQHQELLLMDVKHVLSRNPLFPSYDASLPRRAAEPGAFAWIEFDGGLARIGHDGDGFAFDNEGPRHTVHLEPYALASRVVTNGEYLEFMEDGGYRDPRHWLADGWATATREGWNAPLYWIRDGATGPSDAGPWCEYRLNGAFPVEADAPVCHLSYYEADAFASWRGARLPTEAEWENAAAPLPVSGNFLESGLLHPVGARRRDVAPAGLYGDGWEWTRSAYSPYPGFRARPDALGEYNGKFMANQFVLRGGACVTQADHVRPTYRNFYYPHQRWMFSTLRLARDLG